MKKIFTGKVYKFGDNIDTDIIAPGKTISFGRPDDNELDHVKLHAFEELRPDFYKTVEPGSIMVAGRNFGFGSHREQANAVIKYLGFDIVVADSIARLFLRNSVAIGFPAVELPGVSMLASEGDTVTIDMGNWKFTNIDKGMTVDIEELSKTLIEIIENGGIIKALIARLKDEKKQQEVRR
ncbi:MAG TPA: 3-isopropylmalate dehydratase [Firmicutes bacterium]|nr:3-isopropylmalate dehydratase [Bacillota bacterium]